MTTTELRDLVAFLTSQPEPEGVAAWRAAWEGIAEALPMPADGKADPQDAKGLAGDIITAPGAKAGKAVLYLHGGGYVVGSRRTHRRLGYDLSAALQAPVVMVEYRLAPEHKFPAAVEDCVAAASWVEKHLGVAGRNLVIAGDSAGGGLTLATLISLKKAGAAMPACGVCFSPWVDLEGTGDSMKTRSEIDPIVKPHLLDWFTGLYIAKERRRDPLASPLHADLSGLPPLLIQVGTAEALYDDAIRIADRAKAAGVDVTLKVWPDMIHVWQLFAPMLSEGRDAIKEAAAFVAARWK